MLDGDGDESGAACELTILMPCLNEAETLKTCIDKARSYLDGSGTVGEVLVADNGSTDGSQAIAECAGARVVDVPVPSVPTIVRQIPPGSLPSRA